jgi:hypothetical protein
MNSYSIINYIACSFLLFLITIFANMNFYISIFTLVFYFLFLFLSLFLFLLHIINPLVRFYFLNKKKSYIFLLNNYWFIHFIIFCTLLLVLLRLSDLYFLIILSILTFISTFIKIKYLKTKVDIKQIHIY